MKKLLHNELHAAAAALYEKKVQPEIFFAKLIILLRDHFHNHGLSDAAFRYWTYDDSPKLWRRVKGEFKKPGIADALLNAQEWVRGAANSSRAFKVRFSDKTRTGSSNELPHFRSIMWRYYYRHIDPSSKLPFSDEGTDPVFYNPPLQDDGTRIVHRPWV